MNSFWSEISVALVPGLVTLFGTLLTIILDRAAAVARSRWGIEIEARHREALHSAIMSGVRSALARGLSGDAAVRAAISHASNSVPDAITALNPASGVLRSIAEAKLREAAGQVIGQ
ncbi:hypothetical protein F8A10_12100 [Paracoccus kondratievae]|uniref:hypothetical protein n=1 Tax=Paracoccus kondratievae TaxID=135740 RepID=UPI00126659ED|nr:hypothetical protein [Paracoccus kondratievae]QFQ88252.1 hypothetical protein F8A10_12100 [Paracoccus kondratievae]